MENLTILSLIDALSKPIIAPIIVSLIVSGIYSRYYNVFNRRKREEELVNDSPQLSVYIINSQSELENLTVEAWSCVNYIAEFDVQNVLDSTENLSSKSLIGLDRFDLNSLDCRKKWRYIHIFNNSNLDVLIAKIIDQKDVPINLYDWKYHRILPKTRIGIFTQLYNDPKEIILDVNGEILRYILGIKSGGIKPTLKKPRNKKRNLIRIRID